MIRVPMPIFAQSGAAMTVPALTENHGVLAGHGVAPASSSVRQNPSG
jgi:hypothetical protein